MRQLPVVYVKELYWAVNCIAPVERKYLWQRLPVRQTLSKVVNLSFLSKDFQSQLVQLKLKRDLLVRYETNTDIPSKFHEYLLFERFQHVLYFFHVHCVGFLCVNAQIEIYFWQRYRLQYRYKHRHLSGPLRTIDCCIMSQWQALGFLGMVTL